MVITLTTAARLPPDSHPANKADNTFTDPALINNYMGTIG